MAENRIWQCDNCGHTNLEHTEGRRGSGAVICQGDSGRRGCTNLTRRSGT